MQVVSLLLYIVIIYSIYNSITTGVGIDGAGLTIDNTTAVKGILAVSIMYSHLAGHTSYFMPLFSFTAMGSIGVGAFFFLSGYGLVMASHEKDYFHGYLPKHLLKILIPYFLLLICWLVLMQGVYGTPFSDFLQSFIMGDPISNSWYVFACLYCYFLFWLGYRTYTNFSIFIVAIGLALWIILFLQLKWPDWWYKTICCFAIGLIWGMNAEKIDAFIWKHYISMLILALVLLALAYISPKFLKSFFIGDSLWLVNDIAMGISGALLIGVVLQRLNIANPITSFLGKISYCLYLFHGFVIECYENVARGGIISLSHWQQEGISVLILVSTILIAWVMQCLSNKITQKAIRKLVR